MHSSKDMPAILPDGPDDRRRPAAGGSARRGGAAAPAQAAVSASSARRSTSSSRALGQTPTIGTGSVRRVAQLPRLLPGRPLRADPRQSRHAPAQAGRGRLRCASCWRRRGCGVSASRRASRWRCRRTAACRRPGRASSPSRSGPATTSVGARRRADRRSTRPAPRSTPSGRWSRRSAAAVRRRSARSRRRSATDELELVARRGRARTAAAPSAPRARGTRGRRQRPSARRVGDAAAGGRRGRHSGRRADDRWLTIEALST